MKSIDQKKLIYKIKKILNFGRLCNNHVILIVANYKLEFINM